MFFLGFNFLGADELACPISPTIRKDDTSVELSSVKADTLAVTRNVDFTPTETVNTTWDFDTIFIAEFNGNTIAGNVNWVLDNISHVVIKRRVVGTYRWMTIAVKEVHGVEDLNIGGTDITCESLEYEYAVVPMNNSIEGTYSTCIADVTNDDLVVIDNTGIYHTPLTDGYCDVVDVHPNSVLELLHNRYPTVVRNTIANYETITVEGDFLPYDDKNCLNLDVLNEDDDNHNDRKRILYRREIKDFLTNGRTKILKNIDGQCWLVYVTTPPSDTADNYYNIRKLSFGCTEIGDLKSERDLYYAGLLDVPEEWWTNSYE